MGVCVVSGQVPMVLQHVQCCWDPTQWIGCLQTFWLSWSIVVLCCLLKLDTQPESAHLLLQVGVDPCEPVGMPP